MSGARDPGGLPVIVIAMPLREVGPTGIQTHVRVFHDYLREQGLPARVATPFANARWRVLPMLGIRRVIELASPSLAVGWYRRGHALLLRRALRRVLATCATGAVVYAQDPVSADAALAVRRPGDRVVMAAHYNVSQADEWAEKGSIRPDGRAFRGIRAFEERVIPRLDGIVYVSEDVRRHTESRIGAARLVQAVVVPNFIVSEAPAAVAGEGGTGHERPIAGDLVSVGSLEPRKNQAYLLEILREAARLGVRPTLALVGDGPDRPRLERLARTNGLAAQVRFLGMQPSAMGLLGGYRLYVHAARMESFGMALIEAMASGLPVVAAPVGGVPEVFRDGVEGRYWPLDDPAAAAAILAGMLGDPDTLAAMGRAARERCATAFAARTGGAALLAFLRNGTA